INSYRSFLNPVKNAVSLNNSFQQRQLARNLWYMCSSRNGIELENKLSKLCTCGCMNKQQVHSKAERELVEFLTEEILAERKAQKSKTLPSELDGFKVQLNGAEVTLTKQLENEIIKITFNVNHTVDSDVEPELHANMDKPDIGELKSKPAFKVEIVRGKTTLNLLCSFIGPNDQEEGYNDVYGLDEISIYDGEWNENVYAVSGEVVDSYLYDLILNYLEEKGISNEFVEKLSEYSTAYEHSAYIGLLEGLSKFASG
ncbi:complement component 1 Q subcomponent-binding protein, mitochondrial, partial [Asbolus verrucosus]